MGKRICVYCSSSDMIDSKYREAARGFARAASLNNYTIVCGGSLRGLMGVIIDTVIRNGSGVEGVIPGFMGEMEIHHPGIQQLEIVDTMSRRKELLRHNTDAVVAFPGGMGTLEEFLETYTLKRLGQYDGAVILFNLDGFYDKLLELFDYFSKNFFLGRNYLDSLIIVKTVQELIEAIETSKKETLKAEHYLPL